jgi:hypothetical protein
VLSERLCSLRLGFFTAQEAKKQLKAQSNNMNLTRRQWLRFASAFGASQFVRTARAFAQESLFVEVPPSTSGIDWVHENAMCVGQIRWSRLSVSQSR